MANPNNNSITNAPNAVLKNPNLTTVVKFATVSTKSAKSIQNPLRGGATTKEGI